MHAVETLKPERTGGTKRPSPAASLVLAAREQVGNGSDYDKFLCWRAGEVVPLSDKFTPIERVAPSENKYSYNNPHLVHNSFSRDGLLVNYRQASQPTVPGEETFGFCVATLDLRTDQNPMVDWQIVSVNQHGTYGYQTTRLGLVRPPAAAAIDDAGSVRQPVAASDETLVDAWFVMDPQGSYFVADGRWEMLEPMDKLVAEVNTLTETMVADRGQNLDQIREQAAEAFGRSLISLPIGA